MYDLRLFISWQNVRKKGKDVWVFNESSYADFLPELVWKL